MKILLVRSWVPRPSELNGGDQRLLQTEDALRAVGDVEVVTPANLPDGRARVRANDAAARWGWLRTPAPAVTADIQARAAAADVVFLHHLAAFWATGLADPSKTILHFDDIPSQVCRMGLSSGSAAARLAKRVRYRWVRWAERRLLRKFRSVLVCSEDDLRYFDDPRVAVVPNVFHPNPAVGLPPLPPDHDLLFVGDLSYQPNAEGVSWFVRYALPLIRSARPQTTVTVVGRSPAQIPPEWEWRHASGVRFVGPVDDVAPYLRAARVSVCPLLRGTGTRIKILESLAFAVPTVSTAAGAYGHPLTDRHGLIRADTPDAFASACVRLLSNEVDRAAAAVGRAVVRERYSPTAFAALIADQIRKIVSSRTAP